MSQTQIMRWAVLITASMHVSTLMRWDDYAGAYTVYATGERKELRDLADRLNQDEARHE